MNFFVNFYTPTNYLQINKTSKTDFTFFFLYIYICCFSNWFKQNKENHFQNQN
jgi:hypothetical protein